MLSLILGFLTGLAGPISAVITKIQDLKLAKLQADSSIKRAEIQGQIEEAHDRKAAFVAQAGTRIGSLILGILQLLAAIPCIAIVWKIAYDKIFGALQGCAVDKTLMLKTQLIYCQSHFRTDALDANMWWMILGVFGFLFMTSIARKYAS